MDSVPRWVVPEAESLEEEVAPYRSMSEEQRLTHLAAACRAGAKLLHLREDAAVALNYRDPLPASTVHALARLQAEARRAACDAD